jgi:transposase InsO family protein
MRKQNSTELKTEFIYLAVVLDTFSRKVVGWSLDRSLQARLPTSALEMAIMIRQPPPGLVTTLIKGCNTGAEATFRASGSPDRGGHQSAGPNAVQGRPHQIRRLLRLACLILLLERSCGGFHLRSGSCSGDHLADSSGNHFGMVKMNPVSAVARH